MSIENPFGPGRHTEKQQGVSEEDISKRAKDIFWQRNLSFGQYEQTKRDIERLAQGDRKLLEELGQYYPGWTQENFRRLLEILEELERKEKQQGASEEEIRSKARELFKLREESPTYPYGDLLDRIRRLAKGENGFLRSELPRGPYHKWTPANFQRLLEILEELEREEKSKRQSR